MDFLKPSNFVGFHNKNSLGIYKVLYLIPALYIFNKKIHILK